MFTMFGARGCDAKKYEHKNPKFDFRKFFNGNLEGWGILFDQFGRQSRHFTIKLKGTWDGNKGTLKEWFVFDDGENKERAWSIEFVDNNNYTGEAEDVRGKATGEQAGNAAHTNYILKIRHGKSMVSITADDWIFQVDDKTVMNRLKMYKFGLLVGELMMTVKKT